MTSRRDQVHFPRCGRSTTKRAGEDYPGWRFDVFAQVSLRLALGIDDKDVVRCVTEDCKNGKKVSGTISGIRLEAAG